jgi:hypothetical protein
MRSQSMFEPSFRKDVLEIDDSLERMIWRIVSRYAELGGHTPAVDSSAAYAVFDGLFQQSLLRHISGSADALDDMAARVLELLPKLVNTATGSVALVGQGSVGPAESTSGD